MTRILSACAAALLAVSALTATPALARSGEQAKQAASTISPRQLDLSRQYLNLLMTGEFEDMIRQMMGDDFANDALPDEDARFIIDLTAELTGDMVPLMIAEMVPVYAAAFTEAELVALVEFYSSPMGRSIAEKSMDVMPEANRAIMAVVPQMMEKMAQRMCQHYGCTPAELEELRQGMREGAGMAESAGPAPARRK